MSTQTYRDWIAAHVGPGRGYGRCAEVTLAMQAAFPELERRKGFIDTPLWGRRQHWWLRTSEGQIVDPTALQFPGCDVLPYTTQDYRDLTDCSDEELTDIVPSGVCANCGDDVYHDATVCGDVCQRALIASLSRVSVRSS